MLLLPPGSGTGLRSLAGATFLTCCRRPRLAERTRPSWCTRLSHKIGGKSDEWPQSDELMTVRVAAKQRTSASRRSAGGSVTARSFGRLDPGEQDGASQDRSARTQHLGLLAAGEPVTIVGY